MVVSITSPHMQLDAPLFITLTQCVVAVLCFLVLGFLGKFFPDLISFPYPEYSLSTAMKVIICCGTKCNCSGSLPIYIQWYF